MTTRLIETAGLRLLALMFLALGIAVSTPAAAAGGLLQFAEDGRGGKINLPLSQSRVFRTSSDIESLIVGDPEIAEVVLLSGRSFYVLGRGLGQTNLTVFGEGEWPLGVVDIEVGVDLDDLRIALSQVAPEAVIDVQTVNGRLRLAGTVPDATTLSRVMEVADQYGSETVINAITVEAPQQVLLEVRIIEASRNAGRDLGISMSARTDDGGLTTRRGLLGGALPFGSFLTQILSDGLSVDLLIDALESKGLARSLAEPNLTALSGQTASFLAGGELPIPVAEDDGEITVEYKEFGVRLSFTPVVLGSGLINLKLEPEVSQVDFSTTVDTGLISLPAFKTRRASTTVELGDGQSFAIAGLLQAQNTQRLDQIPLVGDIPVLGALFRSASFQKHETDLVILVTPRLARPAAKGVPLATPLDALQAANDVEFFLGGRQEISAEKLLGVTEGQGIIGPYGHIIDLSDQTARGL